MNDKKGKETGKKPFAMELGIEDLLAGLAGIKCPEEINFGPTSQPGMYGLGVTVGPVRVQILGDRDQWKNLAEGMSRGIDKFEHDHPEHARKPGKDSPPDTRDETVA